MGFTLLNDPAAPVNPAGFADQAEPEAGDWEILARGFLPTGVVSGCAVTAQGVPDMTVAVAAGTVLVAGVLASVAAGNLTIGAADATNPRFDLIAVDSAGAKSVVAGAANANANYPVIPAGRVVLAAVYVPAADTTINANQITDKRVVVLQPSRVIASTETTLPVVNTTVETDLFSLTLPGGLVAAGDRILVTMIGDQLNNSAGTVTYTYRFKIGATTVLATAAISFGTSANRRRWTATAEIAIESATAQRVGALLSVSDANAPNWDTVSGTTPFNPFVGSNTSAEDTSTDKAVVLSVQMGTASASADCRLLAAALTHIRKP